MASEQMARHLAATPDSDVVWAPVDGARVQPRWRQLLVWQRPDRLASVDMFIPNRDVLVTRGNESGLIDASRATSSLAAGRIVQMGDPARDDHAWSVLLDR